MVLPDAAAGGKAVTAAGLAEPLGLCLGATEVDEFVMGANLLEPLFTGN